MYETPVPKPTRSVLILNNNQLNPPMITDADGKEDINFLFHYHEGISFKYSCSLIWRGQFYVFGGHEQQISVLDGCELKRIGTLAGDKNFMACTNLANMRIYLCFGGPDNKSVFLMDEN